MVDSAFHPKEVEKQRTSAAVSQPAMDLCPVQEETRILFLAFKITTKTRDGCQIRWPLGS